jgi:hypothetical protein
VPAGVLLGEFVLHGGFVAGHLLGRLWAGGRERGRRPSSAGVKR